MKYFAYGSNMNPYRMIDRKIEFSAPVVGYLPGYRLTFNKVAANIGEGYANILPDKNSIVEGVLYEINKNGMQKLDFFEGYPLHYRRVKIKIILEDKSIVDAFTYIAAKNMTAEGLKPSKQYLFHLIKAAKHFLSKGYYQMLLEYASNNNKEQNYKLF
jgi:gamma-glutamylcyclotransferase (GGCT)/AIG2-like uncharacterized protein YtfP